MTPFGAVKVVTTAGTPVQVTTNTEIVCSEIWLQPMRSLSAAATAPEQNSGAIYLMNSSTAKGASSSNVIMALDTQQPAVSLKSPVPNGINLSKLWLDADNNGDGVLISYA